MFFAYQINWHSSPADDLDFLINGRNRFDVSTFGGFFLSVNV